MSDYGKRMINQLRFVLNDAYAFVRSYEMNRALGNVTIEDLINEQIARTGESEKSKQNTYDPYADTSNEGATFSPPPVSDQKPPGNFVSGTDAQNMTKMDRLIKMKNALTSTIELIKEYDPKELADIEDYKDAAEDVVFDINAAEVGLATGSNTRPAGTSGMPPPSTGINDIDYPAEGIWE